MPEGTEVGTAYVSIVPSAAGFGAKLQAEISGQAAATGVAAGRALSTGITTSAAGIAKGVGGFLAAAGTWRFFHGAIREGEEAVKVGNLTLAVIRSTGGAAGVTATQVETLADSLSKVAGVDDEVIQAGENVLLTFTKVRDQVGAGNDIFTQATTAALDLSAALGGDLQGSIIQLGKALQDPTQGLLALRRSGVFTEEQQTQIKALQESGNLLGAQKLILQEVNREFGGAAAANATSLDKLQVSIENFQEALGTAVSPGVNAAAGGLTQILEVFTAMPGPIRAVTTGLVGLGAAAVVVALLVPRIQQARDALEEMGRAGATASRGLGLIGKAGAVLTVVGGVALAADFLGGKLTDLTAGRPAQISKLAEALVDLGQKGEVTGELAKQFGGDLGGLNDKLKQFETPGLIQTLALLAPALRDAKRDTKAVDEALSELVNAGHADLAAAALEQLEASIAREGGDASQFTRRLGGYQSALAGLALQSRLTGVDVDEQADSWAALAERIKEFAATQISDWSAKIAGDLTSALNPMARFGADTAKNVAALKEAVTDAATGLTKAKADLAKLATPDGTAGDIARIRGTEATVDQLDAAGAAVTSAARKLNDSQAELAEAQRNPFAKLKENLTANLKTVTDWKANLEKLASRGQVGEALAKDLGALGPAAADAVAAATRKSAPELAAMEKLFADSGKIIADAASGSLEVHLDQLGASGELIATAVAKKYQETITPEMTAATIAAMQEVQRNLFGTGPQIPGVTPGIAGPAKPSPVLAAPAPPPLISVPGFTLPSGAGAAPQITIPFNVASSANPREIAQEAGDHMAWRLGPAVAAL